jgi:uncharacterized integral membrane protein
MGEKLTFQPLTREDRITVVLYRAGIGVSAIIIAGLAVFLRQASSQPATAPATVLPDGLLYGLQASVGLSVIFIHLYIGAIKKHLKNLFFLSLACLVALLFIGNGSVSGALLAERYSTLLLLPLAGCLGFVTAKEAFCFRLIEGYLLAMIMPLYLLLVAGGGLAGRGASIGLMLIAGLFALFTFRKVFMPIAYDIGDKAAYR